MDFSPGVDQHEIHFATIVSDSVGAKKKKALLDVMQAFIEQKNVETRHETERAEHAPWHKEWIFKPYRKWVLHVWELKGSHDTWAKQLADYYAENPVFAVISGVVPGSWEPVHRFCQNNKIPCLFPTTDLPVIAENDFYTIYMNRGMTLEGEGIAAHILDDTDQHVRTSIVQIYDPVNELAKTAAAGLKVKLQDKADLRDVEISTTDDSSEVKGNLDLPGNPILVVWGDETLLKKYMASIEDVHAIKRVYLSTTLYDVEGKNIPEEISDITYFVNPQEMPSKLSKLILRSTGWLRAKRIYSPDEKRIQANAYFALKVTGSALRVIRGYFYRDYFVERVENAIDNAPYTSVYPHIGLAPGQRFVSKGFYIAKIAEGKTFKLENVTEWTTP